VKDVLIVVPPDVVLLDVAGAAEAFRMANQAVPGSYTLHFAGTGRAVRAGVGLHLGRLRPLPASIPEGALIVVPGVTSEALADALDLESAPVRRLAAWLSQAMRTPGVSLMCVCAGSLFAAKAGLLKGRECTTHHEYIERLAKLEPGATVHADRIFVEDGSIFTSAGVTSGIDLTLHIIGRDLGPQHAAAVARNLVVYMRRSPADPQLSAWVMHRNHLHPAVHKVQDAIMRNPAHDWSAARLAALACMSARNLTRLFAQHAGCSPLDYVQRLRVAVARELVMNSDMALERVAERSGFSSAHQLRRVWRRWESASPGASRAAVR
jgi:transcriptional regulator GlxA family with amidase domain